MTDLFKEMIKFDRNDFERFIQENSKPIKPIVVFHRLKEKSIDNNSNHITKD